jgi:hypothetical protein
MNPENLAELLLSKRKVDFILRPGNDSSKLLSVGYADTDGQLLFTCWHPEINLDFLPGDNALKLDSMSVKKIFQQILDNFYVLDPPHLGGAKKDSIMLSKNIEHVGKKLTAAQIKKLNEQLPLAIKGVKIDTPICTTKPTLKDFTDMLKLGADPNYVFAPESYDPTKKKMMKKAKRSILQYALEQDKLPYAEKLVEYGANVNTTAGATSLLLRATQLPKNEKILAFLKKHEAKMSAAELKELSGAMALAIKGSKIMKPIYIESPKLTNIKKFLEYGANPNHEFIPISYDPEKKKQIKKPKRSLLQYALEQENYPAAELLIKYNANCNYAFTDNKGEKRSLLHRMINLRNIKGIELLLANGADVNSQVYPSQMTPLHLLLLPNANQTAEDVKINIAIAKILLKRKPDLELKNKFQIKDGPLIESSVKQSAEFLVKKLEGKLNSQKLMDIIGT